MSCSMTNKMMCAEQRLRSAWTSAQSDQSLCCAFSCTMCTSLHILWKAKDLRFRHAYNKDSDHTVDAQADLCLRLAHNQFVGFNSGQRLPKICVNSDPFCKTMPVSFPADQYRFINKTNSILWVWDKVNWSSSKENLPYLFNKSH